MTTEQIHQQLEILADKKSILKSMYDNCIDLLALEGLHNKDYNTILQKIHSNLNLTNRKIDILKHIIYESQI